MTLSRRPTPDRRTLIAALALGIVQQHRRASPLAPGRGCPVEDDQIGVRAVFRQAFRAGGDGEQEPVRGPTHAP